MSKYLILEYVNFKKMSYIWKTRVKPGLESAACEVTKLKLNLSDFLVLLMDGTVWKGNAKENREAAQQQNVDGCMSVSQKMTKILFFPVGIHANKQFLLNYYY